MRTPSHAVRFTRFRSSIENVSGSLFISQQRGPEVVASTIARTTVFAGAVAGALPEPFATFLLGAFVGAFVGAFAAAFARVVVMTRDASPTRAALASGAACASVAPR